MARQAKITPLLVLVAVALLAACLQARGAPSKPVVEVDLTSEYGSGMSHAPMAEDIFGAEPSHQCCMADAGGQCEGDFQRACLDNGKCFCCVNNGNLTFSDDGANCTCGYRQTCGDVNCKGITCGEHGVCMGGVCKCDEGWRADENNECSQPATCCESGDAPSDICPSYFNEFNSSSQCRDGKCYCCPGETSFQPFHVNFDTGSCVCRFEVDTCDPAPPCYGVTCGEHAKCDGGQCVCDSGWSGYDPTTKSCTIAPCSPSCGINADCVEEVCVCKNGFSGPTCRTFIGQSAPPSNRESFEDRSTTPMVIMVVFLVVPSVALFVCMVVMHCWGSGAKRSGDIDLMNYQNLDHPRRGSASAGNELPPTDSRRSPPAVQDQAQPL